MRGRASLLLSRLTPHAIWLSLDDVQIRRQAEADPALLFESSGLAGGQGIVLVEAA